MKIFIHKDGCHSVLNTDFGREKKATKMTPMTVGIKLRLEFNL